MTTRSDNRRAYSRYYQQASKQARNGDHDTARKMLIAFAELAHDAHAFDAVGGVPTPLLQHVAACISDLLKRDFKDPRTHFLVDRPTGRPDETSGQHVTAMRAYMLMKARGTGVVVARERAASCSGLSIDEVRHMLAKDKPPKMSWFDGQSFGVVEFAALSLIHGRHHARVLNPPRKKYQKRP